MKPIFFVLAACSLPAIAADPSATPADDITGQHKYAERWRILVDLDQDGKDDMLLGNPQTAGNSGMAWDVYLHRNNDFRRIGDLWAHPKAISFEKVPGESHEGVLARVWVYVRGGAGTGRFGYHRLKEDAVEKLAAIGIYPDQGGIGESIYKTTFEKSPISCKKEYSKTAEDGTVTWIAEK
jgi:hypothetical protein